MADNNLKSLLTVLESGGIPRYDQLYPPVYTALDYYADGKQLRNLVIDDLFIQSINNGIGINRVWPNFEEDSATVYSQFIQLVINSPKRVLVILSGKDITTGNQFPNLRFHYQICRQQIEDAWNNKSKVLFTKKFSKPRSKVGSPVKISKAGSSKNSNNISRQEGFTSLSMNLVRQLLAFVGGYDTKLISELANEDFLKKKDTVVDLGGLFGDSSSEEEEIDDLFS